MMDIITDQDAMRCLDFIRDNAPKYAQAKAQRVYLEQFRKSQKAILQKDYPSQPGEKPTVATIESYAYAHEDYLEILEGLKVAVEEEEKYKFLLIAAQAKLDAWRTMSANERKATQ